VTAKEFAGGDLTAAAVFIESLPDHVHHVYVDVKAAGGGWVFVYGDDRRDVLRLLGEATRGRPFRVRLPAG
jgi:hypothetical protein